MIRVLCAALFGLCAQAATVSGIIFDADTQNPLARTKVLLIPLPGTSVPTASLLANDHGAYAFADVQPGWYVLRASRIGFANAEFGQRHPGRPGTPFQVSATDSEGPPRSIVMWRQAAIAGSVTDDNAIGIPGWTIGIYTAHQPIRRVAQTTTDDRGNFRVGELEPGTYLVRSGGGALDEVATLVPSYYKYGTAVASAEPVRVRIAETQNYAVVHTVEGPLFELTGVITTPGNVPARLTLITDTSRVQIADKAGEFVAKNVPPGEVELLVEAASCAGYQRLTVDRSQDVRVTCLPLARPRIEWSTSNGFPLTVRRIDLDGPGAERVFSPADLLLPGRWEFTLRGVASHYAVSIHDDADTRTLPTAIDGWFETVVDNAPLLRATLSAKPASVAGTVSSGPGAVIGAPVYLESFRPEVPERPTQSWTARADAHGRFTFDGLPAGSYRLLSSFDVDLDEPLSRERAKTVVLQEGDAATQPLELVIQ